MKNLLILTALFFVGCTNQSETTKSPNPDILNSPSDIVIEVSQLQTLDNLVLSSDQTFSFGEATQVSRDKSLVVSISNSSSSSIPLSISFPTVNGFKLSINRCSTTLAAKKSCQITVAFSNRGLFDGTYSNTLEVVSGSSSLTTVFDASTVGKPDPDTTGTPNLTVTMSSPFTNASPPYRDVVVKNIGDGTATSVNPQIVGSGYVIRINRCTSNLKPGQSCSLQVSWKDYRTNPTPGPGTINVSENGNPPKIINLQNGQEEVAVTLSTIKSLAIGNNYICGTKLNGSLHCSGQFGTDPALSDYSFRLVQTGTPGNIKLYQGDYNVCYIDQTTNLVYCAGINSDGQFGLGYVSSTVNQTFDLTGFSAAKSMAVGPNYICIIRLDDTVECSGNNDFGQLGTGTLNNTFVPVQAPAFGYVKQIGISNNRSTCVLKMNDNMACAGYNYDNTFGIPSLPDGTSVANPVESEEFIGLKSISHRSYSTCAQFLDNKVKCVGYPHGDPNNYKVLQEYPDFENADEYSQDYLHICARIGSSVKCKSDSVYGGMLGSQSLFQDCYDNNNCAVGPTTISEFSNAKKLIIGADSTCIIDVNEKVICSGKNDQGQMDSSNFNVVPWAMEVLSISN